MSMTATWSGIWDVFHRALEQTPDKRTAFLRDHCRDESMRQQVKALLVSHDNADGFLGPSSQSAAGDPLIGEQIGDYRIEQVIAEGGMGVVYDALRESPFRRRVALKLIKLGLDTREVLARFESERQALALMDHPNIARVFDAGTTSGGRPYFVMEHVPGLSLTAYCDKYRLSTRERLELFLPICRAVQHAHHKGIIHRDLKPSNVLVVPRDGVAVPKVIDFGVAKAVSQELTPRTRYTLHGRLIGTPEYMSPEQAEGGHDIDTRTDIYALGVLLYELLSGSLPFDTGSLQGMSYREMQRKICEDLTPKPSARVSRSGLHHEAIAERRQTDTPSLRRQLRGDLDWIILKAMEKDRTRRYASASELAADIERYLDCKPVLAAAPGAAYRIRKFIGRHRVGVSAAVLILIATLVGGFGRAQASRAELAAAREREKAQQVGAILDRLIAGVTPSIAKGRDTTLLREILEIAEAEAASKLGDHPLTAADLHNTFGATYRSLGQYDRAESHFRSAYATQQAELGEDHEKTLHSASDLALILREQGRFAESESLHRKTLAAQLRTLGSDHVDTLVTMHNLGLVLKQLCKVNEARSLYEQVLEARRRVLGIQDRSTLITMNNLARLLQGCGDLDSAERLMREALTVQRRTYGSDDTETLWTIDILGRLCQEKGDYEEAERLHREALAGSRRILGETHPDTLGTMNHLAVLLMKKKAESEAEMLFGKAMDGLKTTLGENHPYMVHTLHDYARSLRGIGRFEDARRRLVQARAVARIAFPLDHPLQLNLALDHGRCLIDLKDLEQAEAILLSAYKRITSTLGENHPAGVATCSELVRLYEAWGRPEKADPYRGQNG